MRVLVTGASGFIGGHVLRLLTEAGHHVVGFDIAELGPVARSVRDEVTLIRDDVTNPAAVSDAIADVHPECVVHLASLLVADCRANPRAAFDVNVGGTINVLEAAREHGVDRVVAGSSVNVYGSGPPDAECISEETVRRPDSTYAMTKYAIEWLGTSADVEFAALESVHGFGPDRIRGNAYDAAVVKGAVSGVSVTIPRTGIREEFISVEDSARAFVAAATAETLSYDRYLVGTDQRATLTEFVELVSAAVPDADLELREPAVDGTWAGDRNSHPPTDSRRIRSDLGWEPTYTLREMIDTYVEWLETNEDAWTFSDADLPWERTERLE